MAADVNETLGTPESIDRDANIALFDAAAATGTANLFILVSTFEGQDARHSVRLDRRVAAASRPASLEQLRGGGAVPACSIAMGWWWGRGGMLGGMWHAVRV